MIRGITAEPLSDPFGMLQNYRHPDGLWVPGAASRVGCAWIDKDFADGSHCNLDRETENRLPTDLLRYPLTGIGEVFPFCDPQARGFIVGSSLDRMTTYAAGLEGVAFVERLAYERFEKLGARLDGVIRTNGGGSRSSLWLRLRASVLGRPLLVPRVDEGAMGAALLAATYAWYASMAEASKNMVHYRSPVEPDPTWIIVYERRFAALVNELSRRRNSAWPS